MYPSKEVTQKLAKLNICPPTPRAPVPKANGLCSSGRIHTPLGFPGQAGFQTARGPQASSTTKNKNDSNNDKNQNIKPTVALIAGPITPIPERKSSKDVVNPKAMKTVSRNIAETLARNSPTSKDTTGHIATGIIKCRETLKTGVDKILRRDTAPRTGPSARIKQWLMMEKGKEKDRRRDRNRRTLGALCSSSRSVRRRGGALSEAARKKLGLKREGATLGVIKEEEDTVMGEDGKMEEDTVMKG